MRIVNDFLPQPFFDELVAKVESEDFPWFYSGYVSAVSDTSGNWHHRYRRASKSGYSGWLQRFPLPILFQLGMRGFLRPWRRSTVHWHFQQLHRQHDSIQRLCGPCSHRCRTVVTALDSHRDTCVCRPRCLPGKPSSKRKHMAAVPHSPRLTVHPDPGGPRNCKSIRQTAQISWHHDRIPVLNKSLSDKR